MSFRIYREIQEDEWLILGGDCSQGGDDRNWCSVFSPRRMDFPIEYYKRGVAASMTDDLIPFLEWLFKQTGKKPLLALEQNNGGASEMHRLNSVNRLNQYILYRMRDYGKTGMSKATNKYGFATTSSTRPILLGDYKKAFDDNVLTIYDETAISEHFSFIINSTGKPEAAKGAHDDSIIAHAICWQLYQTEPEPKGVVSTHQTVARNQERKSKWALGR